MHTGIRLLCVQCTVYTVHCTVCTVHSLMYKVGNGVCNSKKTGSTSKKCYQDKKQKNSETHLLFEDISERGARG